MAKGGKVRVSNPPAPKLNTVDVNFIKRRKNTRKNTLLEKEKQSVLKRKAAKIPRSQFKKYEYFGNIAKLKIRDNLRVLNVKKMKRPILINQEPKLAIVVCLKDFKGVCEKSMNIFNRLGLDTYNQAVFVKLTQSILEKLEIIKPFISWGYPSVETVKTLIDSRGWANIKGERVRINHNELVSNELGHLNIICIADLVNQLVDLGPHFDAVIKFLWPFKLLDPPKSWLNSQRQLKEVSDEPGYRNLKINELINKMC